jgi:hypothetical protein
LKSLDAMRATGRTALLLAGAHSVSAEIECDRTFALVTFSDRRPVPRFAEIALSTRQHSTGAAVHPADTAAQRPPRRAAAFPRFESNHPQSIE